MDDNGNPNNGEMCQEKCSSPQNNVVLPDESVDNQVNVERQEEEDHTSNKKKQTRNRKRKKGLHNLVRAQMEFYFSDANLSKDRFMQNATKDGPEVPLDVFMTFNRIRNITEDIQEVHKALERSTILKLSDDKSKVSRIIPFTPRPQDEEDLCTIYVEHLPVSADIEWVSNVFKEFGEVAYVSLPKYKDGRNKGFAFVEFKQPSSAVDAVKAYSPTSAFESLIQDPGQLCSIRAFNENPEEAAGKNGLEKQEQEIKQEKEAKEDNEVKPNKQITNLADSTNVADANKENEDEEPKPKRQKLERSEEAAESSKELSAENTASEVQENHDETVAAKKNKKKKKKKMLQHDDAALEYEAETLPLQVMSKREWKKLRNKYLNMQRKCLRQLRINAFRHHSYHEHDYKYEESHEGEYQSELQQHAEVKAENDLEFETGLIVKITLAEPIADAKRFKGQVRSQDGVSYVEAQDGCNFAYVRCHDSAAAKSLVQKKIWLQTSILEGDEERGYWQKIEDNRIKKRDKSAKQKKPGNRGKKDHADGDMPSLPSKAAQHKSLHIRFDDENTNEGGT